MRLSNYRNPAVTGTSIANKKITADVDVTTGMLWWKKTVTRRIGREPAQYYVFLDDGTRAPEITLGLEQAYRIATDQVFF